MGFFMRCCFYGTLHARFVMKLSMQGCFLQGFSYSVVIYETFHAGLFLMLLSMRFSSL